MDQVRGRACHRPSHRAGGDRGEDAVDHLHDHVGRRDVAQADLVGSGEQFVDVPFDHLEQAIARELRHHPRHLGVEESVGHGLGALHGGAA